MKPIRFLSFGLLCAITFFAKEPGANAADIEQRRGSFKDERAFEYKPPIWTGFYAGVNLGAVWDDTDDIELVDDAALTGGVHVGYNWQSYSGIVIGVEGDAVFLEDADYLGSLRGRLGYAFGAALAYATGGVAFIGFDDAAIFGDDTSTGWVAGLGLDYRLRDDLSFGVEGLYYSFDADENALFNDEANFWAARARLTYHLGESHELLK